MAAPALHIEGVRFSYGRAPALDDVNLTVSPGETCLVMGENGSGKTTLVELVVGMRAPQAGSVRLFGCEARSFSDWGRVGYLPQRPPAAFSRLPVTVAELVEASCRAGSSHASRRAAVRHALEQVGMEARARRVIGELSGGQLQRVRIACVLASNPELLILDEPTTGLDRASRESLCELMADIQCQRGAAGLVVTHDPVVLAALGDTVFEIVDGVVKSGFDRSTLVGV